MKILIVGLGSMGKRRARLTKGIDSSIRIAGVDTAESRRAEATDLGLKMCIRDRRCHAQFWILSLSPFSKFAA